MNDACLGFIFGNLDDDLWHLNFQISLGTLLQPLLIGLLNGLVLLSQRAITFVVSLPILTIACRLDW